MKQLCVLTSILFLIHRITAITPTPEPVTVNLTSTAVPVNSNSTISNSSLSTTTTPKPNVTTTAVPAAASIINSTLNATIPVPAPVPANMTSPVPVNITSNQSAAISNATTELPKAEVNLTTTTSTSTIPPPTTTTTESLSEAEAASDEESRSPQTIEAILFDDESTVLKIFIKEKTIEFKIKLNLTSLSLKERNDTSRVKEDNSDGKKMNGFVKKLFIGLESGTGPNNTRNRVVDFFSIILDNTNVKAGRASDDFLGPTPKIEDLHWNKSSEEGFQLFADKCQDYKLKSYTSGNKGTLFQMLVSRPWETCDEEDIQFFTPELTVWWMLGLIPANVEEPKEVVITDTLTVMTTEPTNLNITETVVPERVDEINNSSSANATAANVTVSASTTPAPSISNSSTNVTVTETPLLVTTVAPPENTTATVTAAPSTTASASEPVTTTTATTVRTTVAPRKPRFRNLTGTRNRLRFSAGLLSNASVGKPLEITNFGFVGPLSISLSNSLKNYALYVVLKDCSRLHAQPKRFACVLNDYLDQIGDDNSLAYRSNLAIEKYADVGDASKKPDESIIRNCPFNKGPRTSNHNGIGKTKSRQSKHKEHSKKNFGRSVHSNMTWFGFLMFCLSLSRLFG